MRHIDPEILALIALGEPAGTPEDRDHLDSCGECSSELGLLRDAAAVGRSTIDIQDLETPDDRVWSRISSELRLGQAAPSSAARATPRERLVSAGAEPTLPLRPVVTLRRRVVVGIVSAAAAIALVAAGLFTWQYLRPEPTILIAQAALDPFPDWPDARGEATIVRSPDGRSSIEVDLDTTVGDGSYREVWLLSTDGTQLISLGVIDGSRTVLPLPDGVDLDVFTIVDVSREDFDGNPGHSGDSIVRGPLSRA